ncbi:protein adenylyltransferase SelO family protein, partial [Methylobacterium trifolii]
MTETAADFRPSRRHADLGPEFFDVVAPARFPQAVLRYRNQPWAERVGLGGLSEADWVRHFGRFEPLPGSFPEPLALRYHGHQFRSYNPDLGDGRGFLFAQMHDRADGRLLDLGTKGSGRTPWSRSGDGRLTLKGGVREVLATALLEAQGVHTSKSFSLIETGESLERGDEPSPTRSAVMVRLSHGHIRIGSFQRFLALEQPDNIAKLLDHTIATHRPELWREAVADRAAAFLGDVVRRVARTGAQWAAAGFVHGVLNTDNINVTGESFDYGPWRFLPHYDPDFTAAYFDTSGLYAFGRQPEALFWNLTRLADCLLTLAPQAALEAELQAFGPALQDAFAETLFARLGLPPADD